MNKIKKLLFVLLLTILFLPSVVSADVFRSDFLDAGINSNIIIPDEDISFENILFYESTNSAGIAGIAINNSNSKANVRLIITYYDSNREKIVYSVKDETITSGRNAFRYNISSLDLADIDVASIKYYDINILSIEYIHSANLDEDNTNINLTPSKEYYKYNKPFVIDSYDVYIKVNEDNSLDITETIKAYFHNSRHGIIRDIPITNTVRRLDGTTTNNRAIIKNIQVSDTYSKSISGSNMSLQIGDPNTTITGEKTYTIKYNYSLGKDPIKDADEFYFNIIGTGWDTYIGNITFKIEMPKEFDSSKLGFSSGKLGSVDNTDIEYKVVDNVIVGSYNNILAPYNGVTIRMELPEDYFVYKFNFSLFSIILWLVPIIFVYIGYNLWKKYGDDDPVIETVEFYPPNNLNSLYIGQLYHGSVHNTGVISLLIYLANKGYIKIEEFKKSGFLSSKKTFRIIKVKDYDGNDPYEKEFLAGLFSYDIGQTSYKMIEDFDNGVSKDVVTEEDLYNKFYKTISSITRKCNKEKKRLIFEDNAKPTWKVLILTIIMYLSIIVVPSLEYGILGDTMGIIFVTILLCPFMIVIFIPKVPFYLRIIILLMVGSPIISNIISSPLLAVIINDYKYILFTILSIVAFIVLVIILCNMNKRTKYGIEMLGKVRGFKKFLETAEKEQLESLVFKNPSYFYDILPYTYALGVSSKWISKFESIMLKEPDWYSGTEPFSYNSFSSFMNSTMSSAQSSMTSSPSSGSSGGSSGGGSSGGGSGGGGGSSW